MSVTSPAREAPVDLNCQLSLEVDVIFQPDIGNDHDHDVEDFIPQYATPGAACMDIKSAESAILGPGETKVVSAGFRCKIPEGYEMQIRSRSGWARKGLVVANSPGTIDSDYRGTVGVILRNTSDINYIEVNKGDRIAQAALNRTVRVRCVPGVVQEDTERGAGGFGSTGV